MTHRDDDPRPGGQQLLLRAPAHAATVAAARALVRTLDGAVTAACLANAELVVSELVTNAVRHGSDEGEFVWLELALGEGVLRGAVLDAGPAFELPTGPPVADSIGGFGLHIAHQLSRSLEVDRRDDGNEVRFELPIG